MKTIQHCKDTIQNTALNVLFKSSSDHCAPTDNTVPFLELKAPTGVYGINTLVVHMLYCITSVLIPYSAIIQVCIKFTFSAASIGLTSPTP